MTAAVFGELHPETTTYQSIHGYDVPWHYGDAEAEYHTLRDRQGVIDLSSCGLISLVGDAVGFLQQVLARDVEYLNSERCMVSLVQDEEGVPVDIVTVYGRDDGALLESSFGNVDRLLAHLERYNDGGIELVRRDDLVIVGLEGPYAWGVVGRLIDQELTALPFEAVAETVWQGHDITLARSGFTGEYGYKIICDVTTASSLWAQAAQIAPPIGQQALEIGMLEVRQPVLYREVGPGDRVQALGYNWLVDSTKEDFVGRDRMLEDDAVTRTIGFVGDAVVADGSAVLAGGEQIGVVVHSLHSFGVGRTLGLMRVHADFAAAGLDLTVSGPGGVEHEVHTKSSTYIVPKSWSVPII
jgi:glycine cleavage system aminomethyltransferase T